jgi:hypothetical protein
MAEKRPAESKAFAMAEEDFNTFSWRENLKGDVNFQRARKTYNDCVDKSLFDFQVMFQRISEETPEYFDDLEIKRHELLARLVDSQCKSKEMILSKFSRDGIAKFTEKKYTQDMIRRNANGGFNFHPYL